MNAYVITILGSAQSEASAFKLRESSAEVGNEFEIETWPATRPETVEEQMRQAGVIWNYPWEGTEERLQIGLTLHAYKTTDRLARMACFMSHYHLWRRARAEATLILEDDAMFVQKFDPAPLLESDRLCIGINDPRGATRKPDTFHNVVQKRPEAIQPVPWIDDPKVPQGLAGASAYLMRPSGAFAALDLVTEHGAWPNDALLCKQLAPWLGVTKTYYTCVQGTPTTL